MGSDYHLYQVLGDTGIGLGDDGDPRMLRREFGSATEALKDVSLQFFFQDSAWTPPTRRTPPFANALVATHHSPIVCRFAAGSGAGDQGAGPAAGARDQIRSWG